jgi:hypothetical protein
MLAGAALAAAAAACGFSGHGVATDGSPAPIDGADIDAATDADPTRPDARPADAAAPSCTDRWIAGPSLGAPVAVGGVNTGGAEADPFLSPDELTIYVARASDVLVATRTAIGQSFATPVQAAGLTSPHDDSKASVTADGLTAFVNSARPGGDGNSDVWRGTRSDPASAFVMDQVGLGAVNTPGEQWDPHISGDGLRLYLAPGGSPQFIAVATRATTADAFSVPVPIAEILSTVTDNDPTLSGDERVIVWASLRTGQRRMHYATRAAANLPFSNPQLLPGDFAAGDDGAHLSFDGCRLYFVSARDGSADIFVAELQ